VAREAASGAIAGVITLGEIAGGISPSAYLGYYGTAGTARRGLMTAAVLWACRIAFDEFGLHRLEANIQPGNAASITPVRRLGFRFEGFSPRYLCIGGIWRDHERWALLADEVQHS
jgi:[ribosomal protein S5]-alanine N-acetyltransferase